MNKQVVKSAVLLISLALTLVGCSGNRYRSSGPIVDPYGVKPEPVRIKKYKDNAAISERQIIEQPVRAIVRPAPVQQKQASPAVLALLSDAESSSKAGRLSSAAATIERALRIEPRNAQLVYKLAEVRMQQGKPILAEDLAKKANSLASGNNALKRKIWTLIADSRHKQGDAAGAAEAKIKAGRY